MCVLRPFGSMLRELGQTLHRALIISDTRKDGASERSGPTLIPE
jgi:hypothetical protein